MQVYIAQELEKFFRYHNPDSVSLWFGFDNLGSSRSSRKDQALNLGSIRHVLQALLAWKWGSTTIHRHERQMHTVIATLNCVDVSILKPLVMDLDQW